MMLAVMSLCLASLRNNSDHFDDIVIFTEFVFITEVSAVPLWVLY